VFVFSSIWFSRIACREGWEKKEGGIKTKIEDRKWSFFISLSVDIDVYLLEDFLVGGELLPHQAHPRKHGKAAVVQLLLCVCVCVCVYVCV
jgi:hypothetical protein